MSLLSKFRRGTTPPSPAGGPSVPRRIPRGPVCEITGCDQPASLSCRTPRDDIVATCSDCGPQLGWAVLEIIYSVRRVP